MSTALLLLSRYGYAILFPLSIIEGPIITVLCGFLTTLGVMNPFIVYAIVVCGDAFGDSGLYGIGRLGGKWAVRISAFLRITPERLEQAKNFFERHHHKTLFVSKVFHGVGVAGLLAAGMLRIPYRRFFFTCFLVSLLQSGFLLFLGILFGHAYVQAGKYLDVFSTSTIVLGAGALVLLLLHNARGLSVFGK